MIGLNSELQKREESGNPVKIALIGCGQMGVDVVATTKMMKGMEVVVVVDIDKERAKDIYKIAEIEGEVVEAKSAVEAEAAISSGKKVFSVDYKIVSKIKQVDVMLEATGSTEIGAKAALLSINCSQSVAMMNVETDITVGPILNWYAKKMRVIYSLAAGDEPAACKELYDFAQASGFKVISAGKGKNNPLDRFAKPTDEYWVKEAERRGLNPNMLIEFVDGSKTMIEMAAVSNATGLVPDVRGMHGPEVTRDKLSSVFAHQKDGGILNKDGVVDYGVGGIHPGVFLTITTSHPRLKQAMVYRDMGDGPNYTLFRPYHLCSIEVPLTCAMIAIRKKANMEPLNRLVSEVFANAKVDLNVGDKLDCIGGATFYSLIDTYEVAKKEKLLPIGLANNAELIKSVKKESPITYDDVRVNENCTIFRLRRLQDFWMAKALEERVIQQSIDDIIITIINNN